MTQQQFRRTDFPDDDDLSSEGISFWRSGIWSRSAGPVKEVELHWGYDLISLLGTAQRLRIDILPITWQPALDNVGEGRTAEIREAMIDLQLNFVFKRFKYAQQDERWVFRELISELVVLGYGPVRTHPNLVRLEGICWDILPGGEKVWPVLVFEKSKCGDLERFASSDDGCKLRVTDRLKLCVNVGTAVNDLHTYGEQSKTPFSYLTITEFHQGIIHGDLGPRNILIFKDSMSNFVAKVSDFGFSTLVAGSSAVNMPRTMPWYAPEWHHRGFTVSDAMKMDVFSFGMLCLWFLFQNAEGFPTQGELEEMKFTGSTLAIAEDFIKRSEELNAAQQINLCSFFRSTLGHEPSSRSADFTHLLQYLGANRYGSIQVPRAPVLKLDRDTVNRAKETPDIRAAFLAPHFEVHFQPSHSRWSVYLRNFRSFHQRINCTLSTIESGCTSTSLLRKACPAKSLVVIMPKMPHFNYHCAISLDLGLQETPIRLTVYWSSLANNMRRLILR
jgi:serine/threonine protein kinase